MSDGRAYRFHPLERRGLVVGLGAGRIGVLAAGLAAAVGILGSGLPGGPLVAMATLTSAVAAVFVPLRGRTALDWAPVLSSWSLRRRTVLSPPGRALPPRGVELVAARAVPGEEDLAFVADRRSGTWAAVLPVEGRSLGLLDPAERDAVLDGWGAALAATTRPGSPVHRLQWVARSVPGDGAALRAGAPQGGGVPGASYRELVGVPGAAGIQREVLLVVAVDRRGASRQLRAFGRGDVAAAGLLRRELRVLRGQLHRAEVTAGAALGPQALARVVAGRSDGGRPVGGRRGVPDPGPFPGSWPMGWRDGWAAARVDGCWAVTFWVAEWPRHDVGPDFLAPMLLGRAGTTVSLTMAPVAASKAAREAESARTAELADDELRRRAGFVSTARHRRRAQGVSEREAELADGHGELRFAGYVTVSAETPEELETACSTVEAAAQQAGLELRRLYGQQVEALTWTLPIGRGLR